MNTPNFTMIELNAQERRQTILRQAQQDQLLAALNQNGDSQSPLRSVGLWLRKVQGVLTGVAPKRVEKHTLLRSSSLS